MRRADRCLDELHPARDAKSVDRRNDGLGKIVLAQHRDVTDATIAEQLVIPFVLRLARAGEQRNQLAEIGARENATLPAPVTITARTSSSLSTSSQNAASEAHEQFRVERVVHLGTVHREVGDVITLFENQRRHRVAVSFSFTGANLPSTVFVDHAPLRAVSRAVMIE